MKAWVVAEYKQPLELTELPEPSVGDHDVLVDIHATAVNLLDVKVQAGEFKLILPYKAPFVLGHDLAGTVIAVGSNVTRFTVGDEVYGRPRDGRVGTFAQRLVVHEDHPTDACSGRRSTDRIGLAIARPGVRSPSGHDQEPRRRRVRCHRTPPRAGSDRPRLPSR
jgi:NADPH:quinone reductase-like Zn-dependent oxidoreductase